MANLSRRQALKAISALLGTAITPVAAARLFDSAGDIQAGFEVLNRDQSSLVEEMQELLLALTDKEKSSFNLVAFVDLMLTHTVSLQERRECLQGAGLILANLKRRRDINMRLRGLFDVDASTHADILAKQGQPLSALAPAAREQYLIYKFIFVVREFLLLGYFTSQKL
ncbi:hypothetical protein [Pseudoalteromonas sp. T1lg75]|uniref:hypothetical protein n=1 Tax=Pseudoalteromonas sp. T1lg75 TaxID=2077102 RepID=UPI000CF713CF|nr:hypothetical protein [Pseudoalteromonas sp. T1lg75]